MPRRVSSSSKSSANDVAAPSPYRSDNEPGITPPSVGAKRNRSALLTPDGERFKFCVPKQPTWFKEFFPWLEYAKTRNRERFSAKSLGKEIHGASSFVPLQAFVDRVWPDFAAASKMRAPPKPRAKSSAGPAKEQKGPGKDSREDREKEEDAEEERPSESKRAKQESPKESSDEPVPAKNPKRVRPKVPRERLQNMKFEAEQGLRLLVEKMNHDQQGMEAVRKIKEIVENALQSVEDLSDESTPEPM